MMDITLTKPHQKLRSVIERIQSSKNKYETLTSALEGLKSLFKSKELNLYLVDIDKEALVSWYTTGKEEIQHEIYSDSIPGHCAETNTVMNIKNAHDEKELAAIDPILKSSVSLARGSDGGESKRKQKARSVLAAPVSFKKKVLGVIELVNRRYRFSFTRKDQVILTKVSRPLGEALFKHEEKKKLHHLIEKELLSYEDIEKAVSFAIKTGKDVEDVVMDEFGVPKKDLGEAISNYFGVPLEEYSPEIPVPEEFISGAFFRLELSRMRERLYVPIRREDNEAVIAVNDLHNFKDIKRRQFSARMGSGIRLKFHFALKRDILRFLDHFERARYPKIEHTKKMEDLMNSILFEFNDIITTACLLHKASHIYFDPFPGEQNTKVRFRIDGALKAYQSMPYFYVREIIRHLKSLAEQGPSKRRDMMYTDIGENDLPCQCVIDFETPLWKGTKLHMITLPTAIGKTSLVLRILDPGAETTLEPWSFPTSSNETSRLSKHIIRPLDDLGFSDNNLALLKLILSMSNGLFLIIGDHDYEMSATVHSALESMNKEERKIVTIEELVNVSHPGLTQIQTDRINGFGFAEAFPCVLTCDPDVVMVESMLDKKTAVEALKASSSKLILSTVLAQTVLEAIKLLLETEVEPVELGNALVGVLVQRSARTLCSECKEAYHPSEEEFEAFVNEYGEEDWEELGIAYTPETTFYKAKGCDNCQQTGYQGEIGIHELFQITDETKSAIRDRASFEQAITKARKSSPSLKQDSLQKVLQGVSDLAEARSTCLRKIYSPLPLEAYQKADEKETLPVFGRYETIMELDKQDVGDFPVYFKGYSYYKARDPETNRSVFVKAAATCRKTNDALPEDKRNRSGCFFDDELPGKLLRLSHPGIVSIYDVGMNWAATEFIEGDNLKKYCEKDSILPMRKTLDIAVQIADVLEYLHSNGLMYKDLMPEHIMLLKDGSIKLIDFQEATSIPNTAFSFRMEYSSPEHLKCGCLRGVRDGLAIDGRSDIFSLGVVLFQLLTGELPYKREKYQKASQKSVRLEDLEKVYDLVTQEKCGSARKINPKIPRVVENILDKALTKDILARYQRAGQMAEDIREVIRQIDREKKESG